MTNGQKVLAVAGRYTWVRETQGANRSPQIDAWAARWGMRGEPWCGIFLDAMFAEAGVSDDGICHPSTREMCNRAEAKGRCWNGQGRIPPGAIWIKCGIHTCFVVEDLGDGTVRTLEGNYNNAVGFGRRHISDGSIIIPSSIGEPSPEPSKPVYHYFLEDPGAKPRLLGPWRSKAYRNKAFHSLPKRQKARARPIRDKRHDPPRWYALLVGPRKVYGPWLEKEARDGARPMLEKQLGRKLRPYSKRVQ